MRAALSLVLSLALTIPVWAQDAETPPVAEDEELSLPVFEAADINLDDFLWVTRPIVVFADTPRDPRFQDQIELLLQRPGPLLEREVVVIIDSDPSDETEVRQRLRPRGFSLVLLRRDGQVVMRKPNARDVRSIVRAIDNLPMRIEELSTQR